MMLLLSFTTILYALFLKFRSGPEKLPELSRNGLLTVALRSCTNKMKAYVKVLKFVRSPNVVQSISNDAFFLNWRVPKFTNSSKNLSNNNSDFNRRFIVLPLSETRKLKK